MKFFKIFYIRQKLVSRNTDISFRLFAVNRNRDEGTAGREGVLKAFLNIFKVAEIKAYLYVLGKME